jgi:hypothetical protein
MLPAFPANGYAVEEVGLDFMAGNSITLTGGGTKSVEPEVPEVEEAGDAVKVTFQMYKIELYIQAIIAYSLCLIHLYSCMSMFNLPNHTYFPSFFLSPFAFADLSFVNPYRSSSVFVLH